MSNFNYLNIKIKKKFRKIMNSFFSQKKKDDDAEKEKKRKNAEKAARFREKQKELLGFLKFFI